MIWLAVVIAVGVIAWLAFGIIIGLVAAAVMLAVSEVVERRARAGRRRAANSAATTD
jgi:nitrogen fixation protein FixH